MAGNKDKEMQLFVKIFQAVGMAMQTMHLPKKDELQPKTNTLILRLNYSIGKSKNSYSYWKNDALHSREQCMPILDTTIMKQ
jgi:hypothetical protein